MKIKINCHYFHFILCYNEKVKEVMRELLTILPTEKSEITKVICPNCKEKLRGVGLLKGSNVDGVTFKCRKCGKLWKITSK